MARGRQHPMTSTSDGPTAFFIDVYRMNLPWQYTLLHESILSVQARDVCTWYQPYALSVPADSEDVSVAAVTCVVARGEELT